jgi:AraC-like DNA-binding protein
MFYQSLRAYINGTDREPEQQGEAVQSVVSDPAIGLVVGLLHNQPGDPWTVASLARWTNMSRSAFSERFRDVIGQPPLHYLTEVRMARACHMLTNTELSVKQIAALVGYESPSSFTNAFKRWNGTSPANYRTASQAANVS